MTAIAPKNSAGGPLPQPFQAFRAELELSRILRRRLIRAYEDFRRELGEAARDLAASRVQDGQVAKFRHRLDSLRLLVDTLEERLKDWQAREEAHRICPYCRMDCYTSEGRDHHLSSCSKRPRKQTGRQA